MRFAPFKTASLMDERWCFVAATHVRSLGIVYFNYKIQN